MPEPVPENHQSQFPMTPEGQQARLELQARAIENRFQQEKEQLQKTIDNLREEARALLKLRDVEAETIHELARSQRLLTEALQQRRDLDNEQERERERLAAEMKKVDRARPRQPQNRLWRTYVGFRDDMRRREQEVRKAQRETGTVLAITIALLAGHSGADSERTIRRTMEHYHLDPERDWPPSTWPDEEPKPASGLQHLTCLVAGLGGFSVVDLVSDGRLDHVIRIVLTQIGCHLRLG